MPESKLEDSEILVAKMMRRFAGNGTLSEMVSTSTFFDDVTPDSVLAFVETIRWLQAEELIRTSEMPAIIGEPKDQKVRVVCTANGFSLLGKDLGKGETVGSAVTRVSNGTGYANTGELIGGILGAFTKSIGNG